MPNTSLPISTRAYRIHSPNLDAPYDNFKNTVLLSEVTLPQLGPEDVLVQIHAVSLNWRDIAIATDTYIRPVEKDAVIPCSDGAGLVLAIGSKVCRFVENDRVAATFFTNWTDGLLQPEAASVALGAEVDGMLTEYAVIDEQRLVRIPDYLTFEEASTLPCAGLTAWNALFGHGPHRGVGRCLRAGETVLTEGTGGVSMFAAQLAVAAGADVVSTTSSSEKARKIEQLAGVPMNKIINYKEVSEWGTEAKRLSRDCKGVDFVIEVTGSEDSLLQAYAAIRPEAQVSVIGSRGAAKSDGGDAAREMKEKGKEARVGGLSNIMHYVANTRRIAIGSRQMFEDMNAFLSKNQIHPVVDDKIFDFDKAREAYMYLWQGKHFGNIVIRIKH